MQESLLIALSLKRCLFCVSCVSDTFSSTLHEVIHLSASKFMKQSGNYPDVLQEAQETQVQSLGQKDPLEKKMATLSLP